MPLLSDSPFYLFHKSKKFDLSHDRCAECRFIHLYLKGGGSGEAEKSRGESG